MPHLGTKHGRSRLWRMWLRCNRGHILHPLLHLRFPATPPPPPRPTRDAANVKIQQCPPISRIVLIWEDNKRVPSFGKKSRRQPKGPIIVTICIFDCDESQMKGYYCKLDEKGYRPLSFCVNRMQGWTLLCVLRMVSFWSMSGRLFFYSWLLHVC